MVVKNHNWQLFRFLILFLNLFFVRPFQIDLQLAVSLLAKTTDVTEDDATNCASFIMTFQDFSYLMCLLNTTELQTHSWFAGEECDTIHLDGTSQLMVVDFNYSCTEGYQYVERTDADGHKCISTHGTYCIVFD